MPDLLKIFSVAPPEVVPVAVVIAVLVSVYSVVPGVVVGEASLHLLLLSLLPVADDLLEDGIGGDGGWDRLQLLDGDISLCGLQILLITTLLPSRLPYSLHAIINSMVHSHWSRAS